MTTAVAKTNVQLPAHLQRLSGQFTGGGAAGGIRTASYPRISVDGGKFFLVKEGVKQLINDPANPAVPLMQFNTAIVGWSPTLTKTFYEGEYTQGDQKEPSCSSEDGVTPDDHIDVPQNASCNGCPQNDWGSAVSKFSGKKTKACEDSKRVALLPTADLSMFAMGLSVKPASLKNWSEYVKQLEGMGVALWMVETQITFDYTVSFPKLKFTLNRFLSEAEIGTLGSRGELTKFGLMSDEVNSIVRPRGVMTAATPAPAVAPPAPVAQPPAPVAQPPAAGFAFGGAPAAPPPPPPPPPLRPAPPVPIWSDGLSEAVVGGVMAVGGPDSEMGKQLIQLGRAATAAPAAKKTREKKAEGEKPQVSSAPVPPAPAATAFPTAPAGGLSFSGVGQAPPPSVSPSPAPGMAMSLTEMLKSALGS